MIWLQNSKKTYAFLLIAILVLAVCGCGMTAGTSGSDRTGLKPQLELVCEKSLGNVAEDKIPDVTAERWSFGVEATKPVVSPDGKHVLVVGEAKMTLYDTSSGSKMGKADLWRDRQLYHRQRSAVYGREIRLQT